MINLTIKQAKEGFFDRAAVKKSVERANKSVLGKAGAFVRRDAKGSIKNAKQKTAGELTPDEKRAYARRLAEWKKTKDGKRPRRPLSSSKPGETPRSVTGLLKNFILFVYDEKSRNVLIGPARLNSASGAPKILEKGGRARVVKKRFVTRKGRRKVEKTTVTAKIKKRPYMRPALDKNAAKIKDMYRDSIR